MNRRILTAPCKPTIPKWKIKRAVRKVLIDSQNSKKSKTKRGEALSQRRLLPDKD